jgi:hypothetical protein
MKRFLPYLLILAAGCLLPGCPSYKAPQGGSSGQDLELNEEEGLVLDDAGRITISINNTFTVDEKRIWINGVNTPWNNWNDFGGTYNDSWWNNHFAKLRDAGINAVRVWINCNNDNGAITIAGNGMVSGASNKHWSDLDKFFKTAESNQIYIMATLLSFDHFKSPNGNQPRAAAERWRNMLKNKGATVSFVENYTIPFVRRYRDNPWLWSIDICNEPDWIFENAECGKLPWDQISYFLAINAAAIHVYSNILVTVGLAMPKYNADGSRYQGNKVSDSFLQNLYPNTKAYLDFWSPHYYDWVGEWYGVPHYLTPGGTLGGSKTGWNGGWGLDGSKPAVIGECSAKGTGQGKWGITGNTIITDYESAYLNGWQGVMPWTSNGVDDNGSLDDISPATKYMRDKYPLW